MRFADRHIQSAAKIIVGYDGAVPLHHHLKQFFSADKKYGSKDRKAIAHACYCYFRLGGALKDIDITERIKAGIFLCTDAPGNWESAYDHKWLDHWSKHLNERIAFVSNELPFYLTDIFPLHTHLSSAAERDRFIISHLVQPDLHLRTRPGKQNKVEQALNNASIPYERCGDSCIAVQNATKVDEVLAMNKDVVVQDRSSQRIEAFLKQVKVGTRGLKVWDCCAASGGKSILAMDVLKDVDLTVSDLRPSIIQNLKKRFAEAGIHNYHSFVADLADASTKLSSAKFDMVICDAPCSGSGTWSRSPEQLYFFKEEKIAYYAALQRKIVEKVISSIAENGYLLYITCSVFKEENEGVVEFILANSNLRLVKMELISGYDKKADTMFAALFTASPL